MKGWPDLFECDVCGLRLVSEDGVGGLYVFGKGEDKNEVEVEVRMNAGAVVEGWVRGMHAIQTP